MRLDHARNSVDLLRLLAAWAVLYSHQHALLGQPEPLLFGLYGWGEIGVGIFFFLSGALVWRSWCRDAHPGRYFARRCLRIFPGVWVLVVLIVGVLGVSLTHLTAQEYWETGVTWRYFQTLALLNPKGLPGVFEQNPYPEAVNGSLWSLKVEFLAYVLVAVIGWMCRARLALGAALLSFSTALVLLAYQHVTGHTMAHLEVLALFGLGALAGHLVQSVRASEHDAAVYMLFAGALLAYLMAANDPLRRMGLLLIVGLPVALAFSVAWGQRMTHMFGDVSYGIYIYAFPVQQTFAQLMPQWSFAAHLGATTVITFVLATLSWNCVEKPALRFKPRGGRMVVTNADGLIHS